MQERQVQPVKISRQSYHVRIPVFRRVFEAGKVDVLAIMLWIEAGPAVRARVSVNNEI